MSKNKGIIGVDLIIAIVLGIAVVGGGAYYAGTNKNKKIVENLIVENQVTQITENVSTENWKTYTDSEYGFSFQYPENWSLNGEPSNSVNLNNEVTTHTVYFNNSAGTEFQIDYHIKNGFQLYNYALEQFNSSSGWYKNGSKKIVVSGVEAIEANAIMDTDGKGNKIIPPLNFIMFNFMGKNDRSFEIQFRVPSTNYINEIININKVLSTFKF